MNRGQSRIRSVGVTEARGRAVILFNEEVGHFHHLPADFKDWKAHMSIKATAVVKKETKVDPKKPEDRVHYASLCVLAVVPVDQFAKPDRNFRQSPHADGG